MWHLASALLALLIAAIFYFIGTLIKRRRQMEGLPQPPMKNILLGHLAIAGECRRLFPPNAHMHAWPRYIQKKYGLGNCIYFDLWPLGPRLLFISEPELVGEYVTTTQSLRKSDLSVKFLNDFLGPNNMPSLEGHHWKSLRSIFNPGFSASHLMTLVPYTVDMSLTFCNIIEEKARTNQLFQLEEYATRLTIDTIGKVVLDSDFNCQKVPHPIVTCFRKRAFLMPVQRGLKVPAIFQIPRLLKLWLNGRELDRLIGEELDRKMSARALLPDGSQAKSFKDRNRSVIDLALDAYQKEQVNAGKADISLDIPMDGAFRRQAVDSLKTFVFAGHDTTSSTISYAFYLLHFHPNVQQRVVEELKSVFGVENTRDSIGQTLKQDPYTINQLEYLTAVIKETLRLFPPASTLRQYGSIAADQSVTMTDPKTGQKLPLSGFNIWPASAFMGRNEEYFPQPLEFVPERFIPSMTPFPDAKLFTPAGKEAWRPFEKGPRNCIGQELAMNELKIVLALTVQDFDFVAEYEGKKVEKWAPTETVDEYADGVEGTDRMTVEGHRCYQMLRVTAGPTGGMPGRMSLRRTAVKPTG